SRPPIIGRDHSCPCHRQNARQKDRLNPDSYRFLLESSSALSDAAERASNDIPRPFAVCLAPSARLAPGKQSIAPSLLEAARPFPNWPGGESDSGARAERSAESRPLLTALQGERRSLPSRPLRRPSIHAPA